MKTQNVEFPDALKILADRAGITLKPRSGERSKSQRELHAAIMEEARAFFTQQLAGSDVAKGYLANRGIDDETVKAWELGYAPDVDIALATHLKKKGLPLPEAKALFLVDSDPSGGFFDKFRSRLMFPIRDERGEMVAFGGRVIGEGHPKYINSGDTPLFRKSRVLYGMDRAKDRIAKSGQAVLVEGYLDVIACHRAGVGTAVASLGTSLTEDHAKLLKRWCEEVVVLYDGDAAGQKAAERALEVLSEAGNKVRVALLPEGQDPDTLLISAGPAAVERAVSVGLSPLEFRIATVEATLKPEQDEFWQSIVTALARSDSPTAVRAQVARLVQKYHQGPAPENEERILLNDIRRARQQSPRDRRGASAGALRSSGAKAPDLSAQEAALLKYVLEESTRTEAWNGMLEEDLLSTEAARVLKEQLLQAFGESPPKGEPVAWLHRLESEDAAASLATIDDLLDAPTLESLEAVLRLLRRARENRRATELASTREGDKDLAGIMERLRAAKGG